MRSAVDTSIVVRSVISQHGASRVILDAAAERQFDLLYSEAMENEYRDVLTRSRVARRHKMTDAAIERFLGDLRDHSIVVTYLPPVPPVQPDRKDDKLLSLAFGGKADYIVTSDRRHLLSLGSFAGVPIISAADFLAIMNNEPT